ncbi:hypothetical protein BDY19DRAFT_901695 [Irpex rosettiformis]|uniref:Uncharacterized protein n=1 Tax=Irpex rosettiformis TaxID=378272 RepID=A0ACB8UK86_9APHY|nr:hypothetical protein BDY19DRAFT_901695 [Irpex rosettiformis]
MSTSYYEPMSEDELNDGESDRYSVASGSFSNFSARKTATTDTDMHSIRSTSPTRSVMSMTDSLRAAAYRHEYGRGLNNYSEVYSLPADEEELERLDKQHIMFTEVMGKYVPPLYEVLADTPGEHKACVDLGCGSGSWILDVARDFPHVSTVAVDLVPMQVLNMPPNCSVRSEVDDVNLGLQHFYGEFNVVHARLISSGVRLVFGPHILPSRSANPLTIQIRDYCGLVDHIALALRPRGLVDLTEFDFRVYGPDHRPIPLQENAPAIAKWMDLARRAVHHRGGEPDAANHLYRWINDHPSFEEVVYHEWWFQISPWRPGKDAQSLWMNRHGASMRDDIFSFMRSGRPLILGAGIPQYIVDPLEEAAARELSENRVQGYIRVENAYGRRKP